MRLLRSASTALEKQALQTATTKEPENSLIPKTVCTSNPMDVDEISSPSKEPKASRSPPLSPKMPSTAEQREWNKLQRTARPQRALSKTLALANQNKIAQIRLSRRRQARMNVFSLDEIVSRLANGILLDILMLGRQPDEPSESALSVLYARCTENRFSLDADYRMLQWRFVEQHVDELLETIQRLNEDDSRRSSDDLVNSDDDDDDSSAGNEFVSERAACLRRDVFQSCIFKLSELRALIRERAEQKQIANDADRKLALDMLNMFDLNCNLSASYKLVDFTTPSARSPSEADCPVCREAFGPTRPAALMACCGYKNAFCLACLKRHAYTSSNNGTLDCSNCIMCRAKFSLYDHLDALVQIREQPRPNLSVFVKSISDGVKQNKRRAALRPLPPPPPERPARTPIVRRLRLTTSTPTD